MATEAAMKGARERLARAIELRIANRSIYFDKAESIYDAILDVLEEKSAFDAWAQEARLEEAKLWKDRWHMSDADVDWRRDRIASLEQAHKEGQMKRRIFY